MSETYETVNVGEVEFYNQIMSEDEVTEKKIKKIERVIRNSYEYRTYIQYLKDELDITKCSFIEGLDKKDLTDVTLEFHHTPLTLYDITDILIGYLLDRRIDQTEPISDFDIAKLVVEEHYLGNIGLVPLTKTFHEMAHSNVIIIPRDKIYGEFSKFVQKYRKYVKDDTMGKILNLTKFRSEFELDEINKKYKEINLSKISKPKES